MSDPPRKAAPPGAGGTLTDRAVAELREQILSGELGPGTRLRTAGLSESLEMSPIPLREAFRVLVSEGLVESRPQRGFHVRKVSRADLDDTFGMMIVLEPLATERAVKLLDDDDLRAAEQAADDFAAALLAEDWERDARANRRFHFAIHAKCGSTWLLHFLNVLWANSQRYERMSSPLRAPEEWAAEHERVLDACRRRKPKEASRAMREHLEAAYEAISRVIDDEERRGA